MTFRAPEQLFELLRTEAKQQGHTRNGLILNILWDWAAQNGLLDTDAS